MRRPKPVYASQFIKDKPPSTLVNKFIEVYMSDGLSKFEGSWINNLAGVTLQQPVTTDPLEGDKLQWKYVGRGWWCRQRRKRKVPVSYEFARLMAVNIKTNEVAGLWRQKEYGFIEAPISITDSAGRRGVVIGYNEFELQVRWEDGVVCPVNSLGELVFDFEEDLRRFSKLLGRHR